MGSEDNNRIARSGRADALAIAIVCGVGVCLAVATFFFMYGREKALDRQHFERDAAHASAVFTGSVARHVGSLAAIRAFVSASEHVTRWEFSAFASQTLPENQGFKAVLWIPEIESWQRSQYEAQFQRDGLYGLQIREPDSSGRLHLAKKRPVYQPITFVEPFERNGSLLGVDLSTNPVFESLFEAARQARAVAASQPFSRSPLSGAAESSIALAVPLIRQSQGRAADGHPQTAAQGIVVGILQLDQLLTTAKASVANALELAVVKYDQDKLNVVASTDERSARRRAPAQTWDAAGEFHQSVPFEIAGQPFLLAMRSPPAEAALRRALEPAGGALLMLALAGLLAQHLYSMARQKRAIEHAVVVRTAELRQSNSALHDEIGQRRSIETALRAAKKRAEVANRTKSEFLATMSHELRTPLNAIIGFSSILSRETELQTRAPFRDYLEEIHAGGLRLLSMVNELLELSQMDSERATLEEVSIHLPDLIDLVAGRLKTASETATVSVAVHIADHLPLIRGDERRLKKALTNILSNAIKFTPEGGHVAIDARENLDGTVTVAVADDGIGIPAGEESRILEPFVQLNSTLARSHEGAGLGLAMVKRIADLHGASLSIESKVGSGTSVSLTFPAARVARSNEVA